jgi:hypothetical protein
MNVIRTADVIDRVVAWHNRHPLALRISRDHVNGIGVVVLPFALPEGPHDPARPAPLSPLFGDDWMYHASARRLGAWSRRHGVYPLPGFDHWPLRQIDADLDLARAADALGQTGRTVRHVLTAAVEAGGRRTRVLLAPQDRLRKAPVFGQRLYSLPRSGSAVAAGTTVLTSLAMAWLVPATPPATPPAASLAAVAATAPASAASSVAPRASEAAEVLALAASSVSAPGEATAAPADPPQVPTPEPPPAEPSMALVNAEPAPEPAPEPARVAAPADKAPVLRRVSDGASPLVRLRPQLSDEEKQAARQASQALRDAATPPPPAVPTGPVYAIATRPSRSRDDALALQAVLRGLQAQTATPIPTRLDVMRAQGRWRVVWWPHTQQQEAQALLAAARARGLQVELIPF